MACALPMPRWRRAPPFGTRARQPGLAGRVARRSDLDPIRRSPPRAGIASDHSWGVCARLSPSRDKQRQFVELNRALVREGWGSEYDAERNWLIKTVAILTALAGAMISFLQLFRLLRQ